ncbi:UDP-glucose 4-epimerase GalE [Aerococcaceae bacterium zg-ZJ1578]|uniref:UDP-glucose 4-epimerase GalE n=1 Tax=Aerococcaceae TaxID=186827 RepID=UPI0013B6D811|nr:MULTISPECIES: UDP-glucose 4-epimerase GalE [unclassified Facklamia]MBK0347237.1 UDP-glucose 4-epimerase GalE [Aerococcaceae bacterium zg-1578]MBS4461020.1 UDP-glucose 4-epimerase GalE [Aerococcaceae bacterium zg-B36]QQD64941.1 UDP-glucose 4-epimerase GalE [Aerococcaceae bacterium zg-252]NEW64786.1 UDP-glucose 4-epimerase GalE [Facklamia sp. 252]NEW68108.1 UDP-glucose 4-epimerase GalE [Facklamia sp. 253]
MAVLVTGGAGYIGSHTVVELLALDKEVVIVDNFYNSKPAVLERIKEISGKTFKFYEADILNRDALREIFKENTIESVIHFAGYKAVGESVAKPLAYYHNNIEGTLALVEVMQEFGVKDIVFSSSATVYGLNNPSPLVETMPADTANSPYGYTKVVNEHLLQDLAVSDNEWSITILRYFNPIGAHESGRIGEDPQGIPNNLMPYITQVAVGKREQLTVFGNDYDTHDGTGVRDYIHVVDLAKGHIRALAKNEQQKGVKVYNLGTGVGYSVLDLVHAFERTNEIEVKHVISERRPGDVAVCYADVTAANRELNWKTEKTLEDMCRDSWKWQSNNPQGYGA